MFEVLSAKPTNPKSRSKVPFRTNLIACRILGQYVEDRARVVGMKVADKGLYPDEYGIGTILTFDENREVTVPASAYLKFSLTPPAQETVERTIIPFVGVVAPIKKSEQAIVGFQNTPNGLIRPTLMAVPDESGHVFNGEDKESGISGKVFFDEIRIAREVPIGGFGLRHYFDLSDLDRMSF
ncbi:MAG: hypothetical protein AAB914_02605 [Patescibacteria group bacterium]